MTIVNHETFHTADDEWLASSAAGALSRGKSLVLACQSEMQPALAQRLADFDAVGAALLEGAHGEDVSEDFLDRMLSALDETGTQAEAPANARGASTGSDWMPQALTSFLSDANIQLKWRRVGPGVQRAPLFTGEDGERVYLLRAEPGLDMPMHSHHGEEWTLILKGGYRAGEDHFTKGDLHLEAEDCEHQPKIDEGEACICLVADDGPLTFRNPLLKLLQPLFRV